MAFILNECKDAFCYIINDKGDMIDILLWYNFIIIISHLPYLIDLKRHFKIITKPEVVLLEVEKLCWSPGVAYLRGSHLIGGYSTVLEYRPLKLHCFLRPGIKAVVWPLFRTRHKKIIVNAAVAIFRGQKIGKDRGCPYLEGRFKSNKYGIALDCWQDIEFTSRKWVIN